MVDRCSGRGLLPAATQTEKLAMFRNTLQTAVETVSAIPAIVWVGLAIGTFAFSFLATIAGSL